MLFMIRQERNADCQMQCCGVSMEFGRAMGNDEAVTPVFPNSDYCTGISGCVAVLHALIRRSEEGGSYNIDVSLTSVPAQTKLPNNTHRPP